MSAAPSRSPDGETYYPPRFPLQPPHRYIAPSRLITAECSAVEFTTEQGLPDIRGYLFMRKAIDIHRARNSVEIRVFQRIDCIETLSSLARMPRMAQRRIRVSFQRQGARGLRNAGGRAEFDVVDFWSLFRSVYVRDMMFLRILLLRESPVLGQDINWGFLLRDPITDVAVMVYLWILGVWHSMHDRAAARLPALADRLRILVPSRRYSGVTE